MSERTFFGVLTPEQASGALWPAVSALVSQAIPYGRGEYTLEDIHEGLRSGSMLAVAKVVDSQVEFVVTCVVAVFPRKRVLYVQYEATRGGYEKAVTTAMGPLIGGLGAQTVDAILAYDVTKNWPT